MTSPGTPVTRGTHRLGGIDLARAVAIAGMYAIHLNVRSAGGPAGGSGVFHTGPVAGVAAVSVGFVLLAGMGLSLLTRRPDGAGLLRPRLIVRAIVLLPLGLALQELHLGGPSLILQHFAILFLLAWWLVEASDRVLLAVAATSLLAGSIGHMLLEVAWPTFVDGAQARLLATPGATAVSLLVTGPYPLVEFVAPFALGLWMGRRDLGDLRVRASWLRMALAVGLAGTLVALAGRQLVGADAPMLLRLAVDATIESKSLLWLANGLAWQIVVLLVAFELCYRLPRLTAPFVAMGQLSLSLYVGHLLIIAIDPETIRTTRTAAAGARALAATIASAGLAWAWRRWLGRGPLERALDLPATWLARRRPSA